VGFARSLERKRDSREVERPERLRIELLAWGLVLWNGLLIMPNVARPLLTPVSEGRWFPTALKREIIGFRAALCTTSTTGREKAISLDCSSATVDNDCCIQIAVMIHDLTKPRPPLIPQEGDLI